MDELPFRPRTNPWPEGFELPDEHELQEGRPVSDQWVSSVLQVSSQFGDDSWSAANIAGLPRVQVYGDCEVAWAPQHPETPSEFVELQIQQPCLIQRVRIHESFTPGALSRISLWDGNDYVVVHEQEPRCGQYPHEMRWEEVDVASDRQIVTDRLRLDLDQTGGQSWYEIDAVQVSGLEPTCELVTALGSLLGDAKTADCTLIVSQTSSDTASDDQEEAVHIPVHRGILAARCPLFRAMLDRNELPLGGVQHMTGIAPDLVQLVLQWIYTDQVINNDTGMLAINPSNCVCLTVASDYFQTDGLTALCVDVFLQCVLSCQNAAQLYLYFDEIGVEPLTRACRKFCGEHFCSVSQTDAFQCFSKTQLLAVIECHNKSDAKPKPSDGLSS